MADPKVTHILSQACFKTRVIKADEQHQHHRFELIDVAFEMLVLLYKAGTVKHHGYVRRYFIDHTGTKAKIEVPRITVLEDSHIKTHVILPDFLLPFTRYSLKAVVMANEVYMTEDLNCALYDKVNVYDLFCEELGSMSLKLVSYLRQRVKILFQRYELLVLLLDIFKRKEPWQSFFISEQFLPLYFSDSQNYVLNPRYYLELNNHIVFDSS
uniref:DUF6431 domain-containing protein n=1 Tax=Succinivibrio sp. TaxID=2053619 RepID=UPI00402AB9C9